MAKKKPTLRVALTPTTNVQRLRAKQQISRPGTITPDTYEKTATISMKIKRGSLSWHSPSVAKPIRTASPEQSLFTMDLTKGSGSHTPEVFTPGASSVIDPTKLTHPGASSQSQTTEKVDENTSTVSMPKDVAATNSEDDKKNDSARQKLQEAALEAQAKVRSNSQKGKTDTDKTRRPPAPGESQTLNVADLETAKTEQTEGSAKSEAPTKGAETSPPPVEAKEAGKPSESARNVPKTESAKVKSSPGTIRRKSRRRSRTQMEQGVTEKAESGSKTSKNPELNTDTSKIEKQTKSTAAPVITASLVSLIIGFALGAFIAPFGPGNDTTTPKPPSAVTAQPAPTAELARVARNIPGEVTGLFLMDVRTGKDIRKIEISDEIDIYKLRKGFTIRAQTSPERIGCVSFYWKTKTLNVDLEPPYTITPDGKNGKPLPWLTEKGSGRLNVIPHASADRSGPGMSMRRYIRISRAEGLRGAYFKTKDLTGPATNRFDPNIDFTWKSEPGIPKFNKDNFSCRWVGSIIPPRDGEYLFELSMDDSGRMWIAGKTLILETRRGSGSGKILLKGGKPYPLRVEHVEGTKTAVAKLLWAGPGIKKGIVPPSALRPFIFGSAKPVPQKAKPARNAAPTPSGNGLRGEYFPTPDFKGTPIVRVDPMIDFDWGHGSPIKGIKADMFSCRWTGSIVPTVSGEYEFRLTVDDRGRLILAGKKLIDYKQKSAKVKLEGSKPYTVVVEHIENTHGARAKLFWAGPGINMSIVPRHVLRPPTSSTQMDPSAWITTQSSKAPLRKYAGCKEISRNAVYQIGHPGSTKYHTYAAYLLSPEIDKQMHDYSFHSAPPETASPSITIKLDKPHLVRYLKIANRRASSLQERAAGLTAWASLDGKKWDKIWQADSVQADWTVDLGKEINAKYIKIGLPGKGVLHLYKVTVFGK